MLHRARRPVVLVCFALAVGALQLWGASARVSRGCPCAEGAKGAAAQHQLGSLAPLEGSSGIPRLIHQCWFPESKPPPAQYLEWQRTWVAKHPDWDFWQWSEQSNRQLVIRHYAWLLPLYDAFPKEIMRADMARALYLHRFGGLYIDLDMESLQPVDGLLTGHPLLLAAIGDNATHEQSINNCFMASRPGEPFWLVYIQAMQARAAQGFAQDADWITGPVTLRQAMLTYRQLAAAEPDAALPAIKILEPKFVFPNSWIGGALKPVCNLRHAQFDPKQCKALYPDAYAITYFAHSW